MRFCGVAYCTGQYDFSCQGILTLIRSSTDTIKTQRLHQNIPLPKSEVAVIFHLASPFTVPGEEHQVHLFSIKPLRFSDRMFMVLCLRIREVTQMIPLCKILVKSLSLG